MGNTSGNQRHKSAGLIVPSSPTKEVQSQAFVFDKTSDSNALHETNAQSSSKPNVCQQRLSNRQLCCVLWILLFFFICRLFNWFYCSWSIRTMSSLTAFRIQHQKVTLRTRCYRPCLDGKVVANKCSLVAHSLNGNLYQWFKGIFIWFSITKFLYNTFNLKFVFSFIHYR